MNTRLHINTTSQKNVFIAYMYKMLVKNKGQKRLSFGSGELEMIIFTCRNHYYLSCNHSQVTS